MFVPRLYPGPWVPWTEIAGRGQLWGPREPLEPSPGQEGRVPSAGSPYLMSSVAGSKATDKLTQAPLVSVNLDTQVTCGGDNIGSKYAYWYRQKTGPVPLLIISKDIYQSALRDP